MDLDALRTFVAVTDAGSVNRAAQVLRLSQPAVTRQVQRLEAALNVPLLDRRAKPAGLTAAGRIALEHCRAVLKAVDALQAATAGGDGPSGECRIGVAVALAELALPESVDHVHRLFPRVTLGITSGWSRTVLEHLRGGTVDAALVHLPVGEQPPAGFVGRVIGGQSLVFVAPRRQRVSSVLPVEGLAKARWVLNPDGCGFRAALRRALQRIDAPLEVVVEAYGAELQLALVARGIGFGLVPARALARSPVRRDVQTFRVKGHDLRVAVWALRGRPLEPLVPVIDALESYFVRVFKKLGDGSSTRVVTPKRPGGPRSPRTLPPGRVRAPRAPAGPESRRGWPGRAARGSRARGAPRTGAQ